MIKLGWLDYVLIFVMLLGVALSVYFFTKETIVTSADGSQKVQKNLFKYKSAA